MERAWQEAVESLRSQVEPADFDICIRGLQPLTVRDRSLLVEAPSRLALDKINDQYLRLIEDAVSKTAGFPVRVVIQPPAAVQQELFPVAAPPPPPPADDRRRRESGLDPRYTFDSFVVGAGNQFAHAASRAVASRPGDHYNPLFIYGGVGLGKTHLVSAIGNQLLADRPGFRVLYISSESFMNELIAAIRRVRTDEFKNRFRRVDALIIDDVQFFAGRERTQEEFFHTFNALYETRKQIILTSDRFPKDVAGLEERLRNRFEWGLIADIQVPDIETRVAILQHKAETERLALPGDVAMFLAAQITTNIRELEGALNRLAALASFEHADISIEFAKRVLKEYGARAASPLTIEAVQKVVCDFFHVRASDLRSRSRARAVALPRQVAMYLCRRHTDASFPTIGDRFGGRDHSTAIHATNVIDQRIKDDPGLRAMVERLEQLLENGG